MVAKLLVENKEYTKSGEKSLLRLNDGALERTEDLVRPGTDIMRCIMFDGCC